jgi:D-alanyl-D-alanine dipeptidase
MKRVAIVLGVLLLATAKPSLPPGFVYLADVAPKIVEDMRYAGDHNFVGRPVHGYDAPKCILTAPAARALAKAEHDLEEAGLTLRVYDCYRPVRAVNDLVAWTKTPADRMKDEFYPRLSKGDLIERGYIFARSGHSRGSAVDLTIERYPLALERPYDASEKPRSCIAPFVQRYRDGSIDMGTTFDCMDQLSGETAEVGNVAEAHRRLLRSVMERHGFEPYALEWWHFSFTEEPFPKGSFDFPVR